MKLDDAYQNGAYISGADAFPGRWSAAAATFRASASYDADVRYGPSERQVMDVFYPDTTPVGTVVFVHGGYWRAFDKSYWSHLAAGPLSKGWAVAMPSYDLCPIVNISDITRQISSAVGSVTDRMSGPLRLTGHSAGGHLVARMLDPALSQPWAARVEKVVPISPVADLRPLLQTTMNTDFGLDEASAAAESPVLQSIPEVPVTVWVGGDERPAFLMQARALAAAWECRCKVAVGQHHFDVIDGLGDPTSALTSELLSRV